MPRLVPFRLAAACALALISVSRRSPRRCGQGRPADLRVVGNGGKVLAEKPFATADDLGQDQPEGDLLRRRHRRQRQIGDDQRHDRAGPARRAASKFDRRR